MRLKLPSFTDRLTLGGSGLQVSPFCLGMVPDPDVIPAAFDAGINFFFVTADMHWPLYEGTRQGLMRLLSRGGGIRDRIVLGVVTYLAQPEFLFMPFKETLDAISGLDRIDLLIAGGTYLPDMLPRLDVLGKRRRAGSFGASAVGITFHDRKAAIVAVNHGLADIAFIRYNARHTGAEDDVFPLITDERRTLLYNFLSTRGYVEESQFDALGIPADCWRPTVADHYRFVLSQPKFDGILCSLNSFEQIKALAAAMEAGPLTQEESEHLVKIGLVADGEASVVS